jgi:hypothetical protein
VAKLRCSSLPLVARCAAAAVPPAVLINPPRDAGDLGTAFHEAMAESLREGIADLEDIADRHNVSRDDLRPAVLWALNRWRDTLSAHFPEPQVERAMMFEDSDALLTGTSDVVSYVGDEVRVLDWKSGWSDADHSEQLKGYAFLAMAADPRVETARLTVLRVRAQKAETRVWDRPQLMAWWRWLKRHVGRPGYTPGSHCGRCARVHECPAHGEMVTSLVAAGVPGLSALAEFPDMLAAAVANLRAVRGTIDRWLEQARALVESKGGEVGPLALVPRDTREISVERGWEVLSDMVPAERLWPALKVSKAALEKAVKADAPRGQKGTAWTNVMAALDEAGAVETHTTYTLEVRRGELGTSEAAAIPAGAGQAGQP